ncbi:hypothetical protein L916_12856, partial [Phytophthora nicotianae]
QVVDVNHAWLRVGAVPYVYQNLLPIHYSLSELFDFIQSLGCRLHSVAQYLVVFRLSRISDSAWQSDGIQRESIAPLCASAAGWDIKQHSPREMSIHIQQKI